MRLSTLELEKWNEIAPYVDSFCLPIYTLAVDNLEFSFKKMREIEQIADRLEKRVMGRLLLLPAICCSDQQSSAFQQYLTQLFQSFLQSGFSFAITVSDQKVQRIQQHKMEHIHFRLDPELLTEEQVEEAVDQCYQQILDLWVKKTQMEKNKK